MTSEEFARLTRLGVCSTQLLENGVFREILTEMKNDCIRAWADALTPEKREECWRDLHAVGRLENFLQGFGQQYRAERKKIEDAERRVTARANYQEAVRG
jgi:hypothetical protein